MKEALGEGRHEAEDSDSSAAEKTYQRMRVGPVAERTRVQRAAEQPNRMRPSQRYPMPELGTVSAPAAAKWTAQTSATMAADAKKRVRAPGLAGMTMECAGFGARGLGRGSVDAREFGRSWFPVSALNGEGEFRKPLIRKVKRLEVPYRKREVGKVARTGEVGSLGVALRG